METNSDLIKPENKIATFLHMIEYCRNACLYISEYKNIKSMIHVGSLNSRICGIEKKLWSIMLGIGGPGRYGHKL